MGGMKVGHLASEEGRRLGRRMVLNEVVTAIASPICTATSL